MKQCLLSCLAWLLGVSLLAPSQTVAQVLHGTFAGDNHALSIHADGTLWATGRNHAGQLGTGTTTNTNTWVQVGTATTWVMVAVGFSHSLGLQADGSLWVWGSNQYGQLGRTNVDFSAIPTRLGTATYTQVAAGESHSLALRADGSLWAWGSNYSGELGNTTGNGTNNPNPTLTQVGTETYTQIAAGKRHSLALRADGSFWAWGYNFYGQIGKSTNMTTANPNSTPSRVDSETYTQIAAGSNHSLALRVDGSLWAWGNNGNGQLGSSIVSHPYLANRVGTATYIQMAAGYSHSLALRADGSLWVWGSNTYGELGSPPVYSPPPFFPVNTPTPTRLGTGTYVQVAGGYGYSMALKADGTLYTWGTNGSGQLGGGLVGPTFTPTATTTALPTRSTAAGGSFGLAVKADGTLWTWGSNNYGQLGDGTTTSHLKPRQLGADRDWVLVAAGSYHSLALKADGSLWAWGWNLYGELGTSTNSGTNSANPTPMRVGTSLYTKLAAGQGHSLALKADGSLWAWGCNSYGQLGTAANSGTNLPNATPTQVGTELYSQLAAGYDHSLSLRADGSLWAWGRNGHGQLGNTNSSLADNATPSQVGSARYTRMAGGGYHSMALQPDGSLWTWGLNAIAQLGYATNVGTTKPNPAPTQVGTAAYSQVAAGSFSSGAIRPDGTLWAWGDNQKGELGIGIFSPGLYTPTQEATGNTYWTTLATSTDGAFTLARTASGLSFASTGDNSSGQLGDGTIADANRFDRVAPLSNFQLLPVLAGVSTGAKPSLYPNPAVAGQPAALHGVTPGATVQVLDILGRPVATATVDARGLAPLLLPAGLAPGVYLVRTGRQALRLVVE